MPVLLDRPSTTLKPHAGSQIRAGSVADGLWGVWDGLESGGLVAIDGVGIRHGAVAAETVYSAGLLGQCWKFDGTSSGINEGIGSASSIHITGPVKTDWDFGTKDFSIEAWFRTSASGAFRDILRYDGQTAGLIGLRMQNTDVLCFLIADGSRNVSQIVTTTTYADGRWHHVVAARNNALLYLYVDGRFVVSGTDGARSITGAAGAKTLIGGAYDPSPVAASIVEVWLGEIALVRVRRDVVTSQAAVQQMYHDPFGIYHRSPDLLLSNAMVRDLIGTGWIPHARS